MSWLLMRGGGEAESRMETNQQGAIAPYVSNAEGVERDRQIERI